MPMRVGAVSSIFVEERYILIDINLKKSLRPVEYLTEKRIY